MTDRLDRSEAQTRGAPDAAALPGRQPAAWREAALALLRRRQGVHRTRSAGRFRSPLLDYFERATCASFQMDRVPLSPEEFRAAVTRGGAGGPRTRSAQRARNHVAILRRIELLLRRGRPLRPADVIRWYTSIACGLSVGGVGGATEVRIEAVVSSVNSPRLRFWPAVKEVAALHVRLLADPFVPGFNGILARLLLRYHMGRCGLPPVVFDPVADLARVGAVSTLEPRLLELIVEEYGGNLPG